MALADAFSKQSGSESVGQDLVKAAKSAWGEHFKSHILVHNAGISVNAKLEEITMENYKRQVRARSLLLVADLFYTSWHFD